MKRRGALASWLVYEGVWSLAMGLAWTLAPVYFVRELGMSPLELVLTGTAMELAYFLFEVPTGALADRVGRRVSIVVAQLVCGAGLVLTAATAEVGVVIAASAVVGFGWTFQSGAADAWLMDELGPARTPRAYQLGAQVGRAARLLGIGGAVALGLVDVRLAMAAGGAALFVLALFLVVAMPETGFRPAPRSGARAIAAMARTAGEGGRLIRSRPLLLLILGITFFGGMWSEGVDRLWEAHFLVDVGVAALGGLDAVVWFGILNAGALVLALAVAQPLVPRFARLGPVGTARALLALDAALVAATLVFAAAGGFGLAVGAFWALNVARSLAQPVRAAWLNASIEESRIRATVISLVNLGDSVGQWGGGPALGAVGNAFGIRWALAAGAVALTPALALYGRALRRQAPDTAPATLAA